MKKWAISVIILLLMALIVLFGAAWYFGQITYNAGFNIHAKFAPGGRYDNVFTVSSFDKNKITLAYSFAGFTPINLPGVYALQGKHVTGIVSRIIAKTKGETTRHFILTGGVVSQGQKVVLNRHLKTDQEYLALLGQRVGYKRVFYQNSLGKFPAILTNNVSPNWVICVHGLRGDEVRYGCMRDAQQFVDQGQRIFSISYRNDKGSPQDKSQMYLYGATEWQDLNAAVLYAKAHGAKNIILYGGSMGGAVVLSYMKHAKDSAFIKGIILNAPVVNFYQSVKIFGQGAYPFLPDWFLRFVKYTMSVYYHINWGDVNQEDAIDHIHVPVLLIHGMQDKFSPVEQSDQLAKKNPKLISYYRSVGVHGAVYNVDIRKYNANLIEFIKKVYPPSS